MGSSILILAVSLSILISLSSASTSISVLPERRLPQVVKSCPVDFEHQNYTIITSKCKAPKYPTAQCCSALNEFACPFAAELDDPKNDCVAKMFSNIKRVGKYPNSVFSCRREGWKQQGHSCRGPTKHVSHKTAEKKKSNGNQKLITSSCYQRLLLLVVVVLLLM